MHNAGRGWHHAEVVECRLSPFEELVSFEVAFELTLCVVEEGKLAAKTIDLHAVIDDQIHRNQRVDLFWIALQTMHGATQRRQIDHTGYTCKVLQNDARRLKWNLNFARRLWPPLGDPFNIFFGDLKAISLA